MTRRPRCMARPNKALMLALLQGDRQQGAKLAPRTGICLMTDEPERLKVLQLLGHRLVDVAPEAVPPEAIRRMQTIAAAAREDAFLKRAITWRLTQGMRSAGVKSMPLTYRKWNCTGGSIRSRALTRRKCLSGGLKTLACGHLRHRTSSSACCRSEHVTA